MAPFALAKAVDGTAGELKGAGSKSHTAQSPRRQRPQRHSFEPKVFASHLKTTFANHHRILRQAGGLLLWA